MRRGIVAFALAIVVGATLSPAAGRAAPTPAGIATDPILQPPFENGKPIDVAIGLHVINIAAIDEVSEQFRLDGYLFARWIDPRLAYTGGDLTTRCVTTRWGRSGYLNWR